jgi:ABC-type branched-subunit amino acid transport system ATPase component
MPLLTVENVVSGYGEMQVLNGVSLTVGQEEIVSIVGPNGAGKSTVMKLVFGLLKPWEGAVTFSGTTISGMAPEKLVHLGLSYVPQVDNVFPSLTVEENLDMGGYTRTGSLDEQKERVYELFPRLAERRKQRAGKMSGGERQMVAMGRALMLDPKLLMLDEPSAGLAPLLVDMIFEKVVEINKAGVAVLMVEQNAKKSLALADRGYVLATGQNKVDGPGKQLLGDPEVARLYLGG